MLNISRLKTGMLFTLKKGLFGVPKEPLWACERVRFALRKGSFGVAKGFVSQNEGDFLAFSYHFYHSEFLFREFHLSRFYTFQNG